MTLTTVIIGRYSVEGAQIIARHGMASARDEFAAAIAPPPANGRVVAWYAADDHQWDIVLIAEVDNDDPAYWSKFQLTHRSGLYAETRLLRVVDADEFDAAQLS